MKIKTSELNNDLLDIATAMALGANLIKTPESQSWLLHWLSPLFGDQARWSIRAPAYSTNWAQGGPIIEREVPMMMKTNGGEWIAQGAYDRVKDCEARRYYGPTPLIAAMRCFVASKLGDEVEIPEELA